jgi:alpha-L-fucosidase
MKNGTKNTILIISIILNLSIVYVAYKALKYRNHINYFLDKYTNVVNEFSGRDYFEKENQKIQSQTNNGNRVILFGTQVTNNWKISDSSHTFQFINRGLPHQRMAGFLLRFKPDVIELEPKYVIIEVSSYNFRPQHTVKETEDYVSQMADLAIYHNISPILTTIIPFTEKSLDEMDLYDDIGDYPVMDSLKFYNNWIREYCKNRQIRLIDFNLILSDSSGYLNPDYAAGSIDLNQAGYNLISRAALTEILK